MARRTRYLAGFLSVFIGLTIATVTPPVDAIGQPTITQEASWQSRGLSSPRNGKTQAPGTSGHASIAGAAPKLRTGTAGTTQGLTASTGRAAPSTNPKPTTDPHAGLPRDQRGSPTHQERTTS